ncbi:DNA-3-methyladenine glycosylase family protein [Methylogaea oryzae]|uniref:DNA-3-methyladenine glycosylase family protein n=1 Tax=Methylogaea oryzae TaxID=1295382 RepID=UPI0006CF86F8|nr:DNA-3-methyladenine glycosylase [Methylogaea oryzae]
MYIHPPHHPLHPAERHLRAADPLMAQLIDRHGPCALAEPPPSHFHVDQTVIDQQLSVKVAQRIADRLLAAQGGERFVAETLLELEEEVLRGIGLSRGKIRYIRGLAEAVASGRLDLEELRKQPDAAVARELTAYPGVGPWTAEVFLMFAFQRSDILPLGDLALRNAIRRHCELAAEAPRDDYFAAAEKWRPYRSIASWYLWAAVD